MPVGIVRKARKFANIDPPAQARVALMRFGLGPKAGVTARLSATDGAALRACLNEIYDPAGVVIADQDTRIYCTENLGDVPLNYENYCRFGATCRPFASTGVLPQPAQVIQAECVLRYAKALEPEVGLAERWVHFWSNHFSVYYGKSNMVMATAGHLERGIIRTHAVGKFSTPLKAMETADRNDIRAPEV